MAEVLITLVIIGVVAAITIPSVIQSTQEKEYVTALKKAYSTLSRAVNLSKTQGSYPDEWEISHENPAIIEKILPYLQYTKTCFNGESCHKAHLTLKNKESFGNVFGGHISRPAVILNDGTVIGGWATPDCADELNIGGKVRKFCGEYMVDVNGDRGPNRYGTDIFIFLLTNDGVFPTGLAASHLNSDSWSYNFENGCLAANAKGGGCTSWVLTHSNLDYLHCPDKIRAGKNSCKE